MFKVLYKKQTITFCYIRFPGQYYDQETGLHYNYFRNYDPTTGRYIQSDLIGLDGGINTYLYVHANPNINFDTNGLVQWSGSQTNLSLAGGVGGGSTILDLWSDCACGYKMHALITTLDVMYSFGIKASITFTRTPVLDDGSRCPNPSAFLGVHLAASAGISYGGYPLRPGPNTPISPLGFGKFGFAGSIGVSTYGSVTPDYFENPNMLLSSGFGIDRSLSGAIGGSLVNVLETKNCCDK